MGVRKAEQAVTTAIDTHGLTPADILQRVAKFEALPLSDRRRRPGTLYHWLIEPPAPPDPNQPLQLKFAAGLSSSEANRRANLIRELRRRGLRVDEIQLAVTRFEADCQQQAREVVA